MLHQWKFKVFMAGIGKAVTGDWLLVAGPWWLLAGWFQTQP
jgi:hypothetical protein